MPVWRAGTRLALEFKSGLKKGGKRSLKAWKWGLWILSLPSMSGFRNGISLVFCHLYLVGIGKYRGKER